MKRIAILLVAMATALGVSGTPATAAGTDWWWGETSQPNCDINTSAGSTYKGSSYIRFTMSYSDCDLMPRDALRGPRMEMFATDVDYDWSRTGTPKSSLSSSRFRHFPEQWQDEGSISGQFFCIQKHRIIVDYYWTSWGSRTAAGSTPMNPPKGNLHHHTEKRVCGTDMRWN